MFFQDLANGVVMSLQDVWFEAVRFIPNLIAAIFVFIVGLIVAAGLSALVERIFETAKLDSMLAKLGIGQHFELAGLRLNASRFLGQLVNWFFIIVFLLAAVDILQLNALSDFLREVLFFIPNVVVAVLILLASVVIANFLRRVVTASVIGAKLHAAHFLGTLAWWSVVIFGLLTALVQLNIAPSIINSLITGF